MLLSPKSLRAMDKNQVELIDNAKLIGSYLLRRFFLFYKQAHHHLRKLYVFGFLEANRTLIITGPTGLSWVPKSLTVNFQFWDYIQLRTVNNKSGNLGWLSFARVAFGRIFCWSFLLLVFIDYRDRIGTFYVAILHKFIERLFYSIEFEVWAVV